METTVRIKLEFPFKEEERMRFVRPMRGFTATGEREGDRSLEPGVWWCVGFLPDRHVYAYGGGAEYTPTECILFVHERDLDKWADSCLSGEPDRGLLIVL